MSSKKVKHSTNESAKDLNHSMKNDLNVIAGYLRLMEMDTPDDDKINICLAKVDAVNSKLDLLTEKINQK
jgi:ubiquinone biosynthesis protein UbiJ